MTGPSWLAGAFAAVMIAVAAYCVLRLAASGRWRSPTELDADGVHVVMGVAMAGMFVTGLRSLPAGVWEAVFGLWAGWFGWQVARARRGAVGRWRCSHPVPHLVESAAMLYAFLAIRASAHGSAGPGASMGRVARFPAVALVMAVFILGYVVWLADRLTALTAAVAGGTAGGGTPDPGAPACPPALAPRLAACYKIAMGIGMGYMLILTL